MGWKNQNNNRHQVIHFLVSGFLLLSVMGSSLVNAGLAETLLLKAAESGDADAQYQVGGLHYSAGVENDPSKALRWYRLAAKQGHSDAMNNIGAMYFYGTGVERNLKAAAQWFTDGASNGNMVSQYMLGALYSGGLGVAVDRGAAKNWYERAANQGHPDAHLRLAMLHHTGVDGEHDLALAIEWYEKAAALNVLEAAMFLGDIYGSGQDKFYDLDKSIAWYVTALEAGLEDAEGFEVAVKLVFVNLAVLHEKRASEGDLIQAFNWAKRGAESGDGNAQNMLATYYFRGTGTEIDTKLGVRWLREAARQGHAISMYHLGRLHYYGALVPDNLVLAHVYIDLAERAGYSGTDPMLSEVVEYLKPEQLVRAKQRAEECLKKNYKSC